MLKYLSKEVIFMSYNEYNENPVQKTYKQRKKKKLKRKVKVIISLFIFIMITMFLISDYPRVKSIKIEGVHQTPQQEILKHISIKPSSYYFFINKEKVIKEIKQLPTITKASIDIDLIGNVVIGVEEATPIAYASLNNKIYAINDIGRIVEVRQSKQRDELKVLPYIQNFQSKTMLEEFARGFYKVPTLMQNEMSDIILEPQAADPTRLKCLMKDNKVVYVRVEDVATKLNTHQFSYEALKNEHKNACYFSIEGRNVYTRSCQ